MVKKSGDELQETNQLTVLTHKVRSLQARYQIETSHEEKGTSGLRKRISQLYQLIWSYLGVVVPLNPWKKFYGAEKCCRHEPESKISSVFMKNRVRRQKQEIPNRFVWVRSLRKANYRTKYSIYLP